MRIVGPNTIGAYCGAAKITMSTPRHAPDAPGGITFISQSGTYAWDMIHRAKVLGLPLGKSLSCGNCADVTPTDYLLYAAEDPDTDIVAMYLETDLDAGRFFRLAREIGKPLVLFRGGRSAAGMRAATSHTGALAADGNLWLAAARQAGAAVVDSMDELLDVLLAHAAFGTVSGRRLALFGSGGGVSVVSADVADANGMTFAAFGDETRRRLGKFGVPGTSVDNPIDIPVWGLKSDGIFIFHEIVELLAADAAVESIIAYVEMNSIFEFSDEVAEGRSRNGGHRPVAAARGHGGHRALGRPAHRGRQGPGRYPAQRPASPARKRYRRLPDDRPRHPGTRTHRGVIGRPVAGPAQAPIRP